MSKYTRDGEKYYKQSEHKKAYKWSKKLRSIRSAEKGITFVLGTYLLLPEKSTRITVVTLLDALLYAHLWARARLQGQWSPVVIFTLRFSFEHHNYGTD